MEENKQDALIRAYATLTSLRKNIGEMAGHNVLETYVHEFHTVLNRLESIGENIDEFRIPDSEIAPRETVTVRYVGADYRHTPHYSKEKYVDKPFILTKLDAILGYFEIIISEKPRRIGFRTPENK